MWVTLWTHFCSPAPPHSRILCSLVIHLDRRGEASLHETLLYCIDCGSHSEHGGRAWWGLLSHTPKFKPFPEARPNKGSRKGPSSGAVSQRSAASLKNNRKHMWGTRYREGRRAHRAARNQEPSTETWPDPAGSHWHFLIRYIRAKVAAVGLPELISVLNSAAGNSLGTEGDGRSERKGWRMFLFYLWRGPSVAVSCLHNR